MAPNTFRSTASALAETGRRFYARGWALGTSGNFSAVVSRHPLRLAITASGRSKRELVPANVVLCDARGKALHLTSGSTRGRAAKRQQGTLDQPSAEAHLHLEIVHRQGAGAVLHTHSVWSTMLSDRHAGGRGLSIEGYEMLKGLAGIATHEHREWIPILENDQDIPRLARTLGEVLTTNSRAHAVLLRRHGLYTWGATLAEAERHVEILEFLFEVIGRAEGYHGTPQNS
jgi:methylthioribulose-1-phosphate dehydratase